MARTPPVVAVEEGPAALDDRGRCRLKTARWWSSRCSGKGSHASGSSGVLGGRPLRHNSKAHFRNFERKVLQHTHHWLLCLSVKRGGDSAAPALRLIRTDSDTHTHTYHAKCRTSCARSRTHTMHSAQHCCIARVHARAHTHRHTQGHTHTHTHTHTTHTHTHSHTPCVAVIRATPDPHGVGSQPECLVFAAGALPAQLHLCPRDVFLQGARTDNVNNPPS